MVWFESYLSERRQFVREIKSVSDLKEVNIGVPQGSILGPLLFAIYINDLSDLLLNADIYFYADDSNLVFSGNNFFELETKINSSLILINKWMSDNRFTLNVEKSKYMLISPSGRHSSNINIKIGERTLESVNELKILGVIFDKRLSSKSHINFICDKLNKRVNVLTRLRHFMPKKTLNLIYKSLALPIIDYSVCVYGYTYSSHLERIQRLQRRAAHVIMSSDLDYKILFKKLEWIPFLDRRNYFCCVFIYKCLNRLNANKCHNLFKIPSISERPLRTRSATNQEIVLPKSHLQCFLNTLFYSGIKIFNNLDINIRNTSTFNTFITYLKRFYNN